MVRQLEAIYEDGVLHPVEPLKLRQRQRVRLTIDDGELKPDAEPVNYRYEEMRWLDDNSALHPGEWVALDGYNLVAHGDSLKDVSEAAKARGVERPFFSRRPLENELPFGGW